MKTNAIKAILAFSIIALLASCSTSKPTKQKVNKVSAIKMTTIKKEEIINYARTNRTKSQHNNIWSELRSNFSLPNGVYYRVQDALSGHISKPEHLKNITNASKPYIHYIVSQLKKRNMPLDLALLPMVESSYNPKAVSRSGAAGLWQFMPKTARMMNLYQGSYYDGRYDVIASTNAALDYLTYLYDKFNDWELAIAAYNGGEGTISRAMAANASRGLGTDFWSLHNIPTETKNYLPKLLAYRDAISNPRKYGATLTLVENKAYFTALPTVDNLSISDIAYSANISREAVLTLNPALKQGLTTSAHDFILMPLDADFKSFSEDYYLSLLKRGMQNTQPLNDMTIIPETQVAFTQTNDKQVQIISTSNITNNNTTQVPTIAKALPNFNQQTIITNKQHTVSQGETLYNIAKQHNVSVELLKTNNKLFSNDLVVGQVLIFQ